MPKTTRSNYLDEPDAARRREGTLTPQLTAAEPTTRPEAGGSFHGELLSNLWIAVRVTFIVVTIAGLWRMGPPMRVIVVVAGVAALGLLGAVIMLIVITVRREQRKKGIGDGQSVTPIE